VKEEGTSVPSPSFLVVEAPAEWFPTFARRCRFPMPWLLGALTGSLVPMSSAERVTKRASKDAQKYLKRLSEDEWNSLAATMMLANPRIAQEIGFAYSDDAMAVLVFTKVISTVMNNYIAELRNTGRLDEVIEPYRNHSLPLGIALP
jgi:hypothetical protein